MTKISNPLRINAAKLVALSRLLDESEIWLMNASEEELLKFRELFMDYAEGIFESTNNDGEPNAVTVQA